MKDGLHPHAPGLEILSRCVAPLVAQFTGAAIVAADPVLPFMAAPSPALPTLNLVGVPGGGRGADDAAPPASGATPGAASAAAALSLAEASGGPHDVLASAPEARWGSRGSAVANAGAPAPAAALASRRRGGQGLPE